MYTFAKIHYIINYIKHVVSENIFEDRKFVSVVLLY